MYTRTTGETRHFCASRRGHLPAHRHLLESGEFGIVRLVSRPAMREDGSGRNWTKSFAAAATKPAAEQVGAVVPTSPATINSPVSPVSPTNASPPQGSRCRGRLGARGAVIGAKCPPLVPTKAGRS
eukprot:Hpha_TRINITY_DN15572_c0_g2::TRINITY_DN15572_c0_g2_i2::g.106442::m.106442